jgi:hypothetical protein
MARAPLMWARAPLMWAPLLQTLTPLTLQTLTPLTLQTLTPLTLQTPQTPLMESTCDCSEIFKFLFKTDTVRCNTMNTKAVCDAIRVLHDDCVEYKSSDESLRLSKLILRHTRGVQIDIRSSSRVFKSNKYSHALCALYAPKTAQSIVEIICSMPLADWYESRSYDRWISRIDRDCIVFGTRQICDFAILFFIQRNPSRDIQHDTTILWALVAYFHSRGCNVLIRYIRYKTDSLQGQQGQQGK